MPGEPELRMPVQAVRGHAGSVDAVAEAIETGRAAAAQVQLGSHAYGQLCAFLPRLIDPLADRTVSALAGSALALRETAAHLRDAAELVESADEHSADRLRSAGGGLAP